ncbi:MAG: hypothetical protein M5U09_18845 [Gammaproteobacteria bacterium]|nr:hypothetical protein [Gammaproteobacteria bacterium]
MPRLERGARLGQGARRPGPGAAARLGGSEKDPIPVTEGLVLHRATRRNIAPVAKFTPILFYETPPFSAEQWRWFQENPKHWETARGYWKDPDRQVDAY